MAYEPEKNPGQTPGPKPTQPGQPQPPHKPGEHDPDKEKDNEKAK